MAKKTLIYDWDEQTGRMRLHGRNLGLSEHDRTALESELRRRYESLLEQLDSGSSDAVMTFQTTVTEARRVSGFRIRYSGASRARCPGLVLEPILRRKAESRPSESPAAADASDSRRSAAPHGAAPPTAPAAAFRELAVPRVTPWFVGFLDDVRERLSEKPRSHLTIDDCDAMRFILAGLQELCRDKPEDLARIPIGRIDLKFLAIRERPPGGVFR